MPDITVSPPEVGRKAYFTFKEPFASYIKSLINTADNAIPLTVTGVMDMEELKQLNFIDPYTNIYAPVNISEYEFKDDYINNVPIVTFKHVTETARSVYVRVPLSYVAGGDNVLEVPYINKLILLDLGYLPLSQDLSTALTELTDTLSGLTGVTAEVKEVAIGDITLVAKEEHDIRVAVNNNAKTVHKSTKLKLLELQAAHDQLLNRLTQLNISLG